MLLLLPISTSQQGLTFTDDGAVLFTVEQSGAETNVASLAIDECAEAREALLLSITVQTGSP